MATRRSHSAFSVRGPETGPAIVFIHGMWLNRSLWEPQVAELSQDYRTITVDLPGHGALSETPFDLDSSVQFLNEIISNHAGGRAIVVGLSLGGYVGLELAAHYPDRVSGLIASGCTTNLNNPFPLLYAGSFFLPRAGGERFHNKFARFVMSRRFGSRANPMLEAGIRFHSTPRGVANLIRTDFLSRISAYPGSVLLINGEYDIVFRRQERDYVSAASNARLHIIRDAGHMCTLQKPDDFTRAVREFAQLVN